MGAVAAIGLALSLALASAPPPPATGRADALAPFGALRAAERPAGGWLAQGTVRLCDPGDEACLAGDEVCGVACFELDGKTLTARFPEGERRYDLGLRAQKPASPLFVAVVEGAANQRGPAPASDPCGGVGVSRVRLAEFATPAPALTVKEQGRVGVGYDDVWITLTCADGGVRTFLRQIGARHGG